MYILCSEIFTVEIAVESFVLTPDVAAGLDDGRETRRRGRLGGGFGCTGHGVRVRFQKMMYVACVRHDIFVQDRCMGHRIR